jgi:hypothetical protein
VSPLMVSLEGSAAVRARCESQLGRTIPLAVPGRAILTDNGREFCGTKAPPSELNLELNGIEHRAPGSSARRHQRLHRALQLLRSVEGPQPDLGVWLVTAMSFVGQESLFGHYRLI